jgi:galactonate dehydratase
MRRGRGADQDVPYAQPAMMPAELRKLDRVGGALKITKLETLLVKPRWLFLKIHTDAGIVGLGEPIIEGRALTVRAARRGDRAVPDRKDPAASSTTGRPSTATRSTAAGRS